MGGGGGNLKGGEKINSITHTLSLSLSLSHTHTGGREHRASSAFDPLLRSFGDAGRVECLGSINLGLGRGCGFGSLIFIAVTVGRSALL